MDITQSLNTVACKIPQKEAVAAILQSAIHAADPVQAVQRRLCRRGSRLMVNGLGEYPLIRGGRLLIIALGKAAPAMVQGAAACLGGLIRGGVCVTKRIDPASVPVAGISYLRGDHPVPGDGSLVAGMAIRATLAGLNEDDIVLVLLSGGGSALATLPVEGVSLADLQQTTDILLKAGVTITELNTVRKHLDLLKGGGLLRMAAPAKVIALVLSDVVGNPLEVIASGPAYPDETTYAAALQIVRREEMNSRIPNTVIYHLQQGMAGYFPETVKPGELVARSAGNLIIGSNIDSCRAAVAKAVEHGFFAELVTDHLTGEARDAGVLLGTVAREAEFQKTPWLLVYGGETTVTVRGQGRGGRNQEVALAAVRGMAGLTNRLLITLATDGEDGPTDAAGAVVDGTTMERAKIAGMDVDTFLAQNDAYHYFAKLSDLLITGSTGTNVNDINFVIGFD